MKPMSLADFLRASAGRLHMRITSSLTLPVCSSKSDAPLLQISACITEMTAQPLPGRGLIWLYASAHCVFHETVSMKQF